eukprot:3637051-Pyramimonas_sp.AAC.1
MQQRAQAQQGQGPINITGSGSTILILKWASTNYQHMPWDLICKNRAHGTDFLFNIWEFTA